VKQCAHTGPATSTRQTWNSWNQELCVTRIGLTKYAKTQKETWMY